MMERAGTAWRLPNRGAAAHLPHLPRPRYGRAFAREPVSGPGRVHGTLWQADSAVPLGGRLLAVKPWPGFHEGRLD
ncbi:hypothetical protein [Streptomyces sp. NPDC057939]|uniref:hypothetical protein n=1 Tax=Streptomyces sp. NPDC057939 TaxID=3346284 RepID=UPI0036EF97E8